MVLPTCRHDPRRLPKQVSPGRQLSSTQRPPGEKKPALRTVPSYGVLNHHSTTSKTAQTAKAPRLRFDELDPSRHPYLILIIECLIGHSRIRIHYFSSNFVYIYGKVFYIDDEAFRTIMVIMTGRTEPSGNRCAAWGPLTLALINFRGKQ